MRLEAGLPRQDQDFARAAAQKNASALLAFVLAAYPDTQEPIAAHAARIFGLPDAPAMRALLRGEDAKTIARERYGSTWREDMKATAAASAAALEAAHGSDWQAQQLSHDAAANPGRKLFRFPEPPLLTRSNSRPVAVGRPMSTITHDRLAPMALSNSPPG